MIRRAESTTGLGSLTGDSSGLSWFRDTGEKFEDCLTSSNQHIPLLAAGLPAALVAVSQPKVVSDRGPLKHRRSRQALISATNEMFENLLGMLAGD